jgi:small subunit ribosomal protein S9
VRIRPGSGKFIINRREMDEYFPREVDRLAVRTPLATAKAEGQWDIYVNVKGGGLTGQSGAVLLGLARALIKAAPAVESALRDQDLLTRDARKVERKKPGRRKARRSFQFSKR